MSDLSGWHVEGVILCPGDCGLYFDVNCSLPDLEAFAEGHDCARPVPQGST